MAGIILTGNELSQISLALLLTYYGGQRNRPRWMAWGMVFSAISCFLLAAPHFIYGAGDEALQYTREYGSKSEVIMSERERKGETNIFIAYVEFFFLQNH